ncbi:hypothetical protein JB92DRAFT_2856927 [Gautieria morchelliformis]|nr:hypothetical protein JB92DRAFT_2856927 [Gautieria morchelliformis]
MVVSHRTLAHEPSFKYEHSEISSAVSNATTPSSLSAASTSTTAIASLSTSSLPSTQLPMTCLQTLHVTTLPGEPSLTLHVRSRAPSSHNIPTFHGGDVIMGNVVLSLTPKEAQYVTSVEIELQGEISAPGRPPHRFLTKRSTLWTSTVSIKHNSTSSVSSREVEAPSHTVKSTQLNRPRIRLEPSRSHVWPVEVSLPTYIFSSETPASSQSPHLFHPGMVEGDRTESTQESGGKGGVRAETVGYGFDWVKSDESLCFRHDRDAMELGQKEQVLEWINSTTPRRVLLEDGTDLSPVTVEGTVRTSRDKEHAFKLPPSFSEGASVACLEYKLVVTVHRRGLLRDDKSLHAKLHVLPHSYLASEPSTGDPLRTSHPPVVASQLPGPSENPDGWNLTPEVVMQLQPKLRRSGGVVDGDIAKEIVLKLALSRPLCYARGTTIPFRLTISIPHPYISASKELERSTGRKSKVSLASPSTAISMPFLVPSVPPLFRKVSIACSMSCSTHVETRAPSNTPPRSPLPKLSLAPSSAAIAASIRLVRATHAGPDANYDGNTRRRCASFLHTASTAVIHDEPMGNTAADDVEETHPELKGWATEQGRLVRTFAGEIPLKEDIKPTFAFSHFVLQYAVVLFPFEVSGFTPSSNEPLWSEPVNITAHPPRKPRPVPTLISANQPL